MTASKELHAAFVRGPWLCDAGAAFQPGGLQVLMAAGFGLVVVGGFGLFWRGGYGENRTRGFDDQAVGGVAGAVRDEGWSVLDSEHDHSGALLLCVLDDGVGEVGSADGSADRGEDDCSAGDGDVTEGFGHDLRDDLALGSSIRRHWQDGEAVERRLSGAAYRCGVAHGVNGGGVEVGGEDDGPRGVVAGLAHPGANGDDWARGFSEDGLGGGSEDEALEATGSVGSEDEQVGLLFCGGFEDGGNGEASGDFGITRDAAMSRGLEEMVERAFGLLIQGLEPDGLTGLRGRHGFVVLKDVQDGEAGGEGLAEVDGRFKGCL